MIQSETVNVRQGENFWLWFIKLITGVLIVAFLLIHFIVNHLLPATGLLTHADVLVYYQNPLVIVMEALFLVFVVSHSLIGTRSIILDLRPSDMALRVIDVLLVVVGVGATVYGLWLIQAILAQI